LGLEKRSERSKDQIYSFVMKQKESPTTSIGTWDGNFKIQEEDLEYCASKGWSCAK
jgi:hypothetical protein